MILTRFMDGMDEEAVGELRQHFYWLVLKLVSFGTQSVCSVSVSLCGSFSGSFGLSARLFRHHQFVYLSFLVFASVRSKNKFTQPYFYWMCDLITWSLAAASGVQLSHSCLSACSMTSSPHCHSGLSQYFTAHRPDQGIITGLCYRPVWWPHRLPRIRSNVGNHFTPWTYTVLIIFSLCIVNIHNTQTQTK